MFDKNKEKSTGTKVGHRHHKTSEQNSEVLLLYTVLSLIL